MRHARLFILLLFFAAASCAVADDAVPVDTVQKKGSAVVRTLGKVGKVFGDVFAPDVDSSYIELTPFNFQTMVQGSACNESFILSEKDEYSMELAPNTAFKVGPYFGWQWIFAGYGFNVNSFRISRGSFDINTSFYARSLCLDIVYRQLGADYKIKRMSVENEDVTDIVGGTSFDGLDINVTSLNLYYVLNHRKYSHQAAFSQTHRQKRSAGSWILGTGYYECSLSLDWDEMMSQVIKRIGAEGEIDVGDDMEKHFSEVRYKYIPMSVGYGYNWVFAKNWLFGMQASASLCYMWSNEYADWEVDKDTKTDKKFMQNVTFDGTVRAGLIWNNSKWFAGMGAVYHTYYYHRSAVSVNNLFGRINLFVGFNFQRNKRNKK